MRQLPRFDSPLERWALAVWAASLVLALIGLGVFVFSGSALDQLFWAGIIAAAAPGPLTFIAMGLISLAARRREARTAARRRICVRCGYDRDGLRTDQACPECGTPVPDPGPPSAPDVPASPDADKSRAVHLSNRSERVGIVLVYVSCVPMLVNVVFSSFLWDRLESIGLPTWTLIAVSPPFFVVGMVLLLSGWWRLQKRIHQRTRVCVFCGYQRHGMPPSAACPECGRAVPDALPNGTIVPREPETAPRPDPRPPLP